MDKNTDDEILFDILSVENEAVKSYSYALISCTTKPIHDNFMTILCDQHQICLDVKDELTKRGFLSCSESDKEEIKSVLDQFKIPK